MTDVILCGQIMCPKLVYRCFQRPEIPPDIGGPVISGSCVQRPEIIENFNPVTNLKQYGNGKPFSYLYG